MYVNFLKVLKENQVGTYGRCVRLRYIFRDKEDCSMVTNFGKFCRKVRIDNSELLLDMAKRLGVSSAFLSKVENGYKKPPMEWKDKLVESYQLKPSEISELEHTIFEARNCDYIDMSLFSNDSREMLLSFARKLNDMDGESIEKIKSLLKDKQEE